jgi:outer membrane protein TolC
MTAADIAEAEAFAAETAQIELAAQGAIVEAQVELGDAMGRGEVETLSTSGELPGFELPDPEEIERRLRDVDRAPRVIAARVAVLAARSRDAELSAQRSARMDVDLFAYRESPAGLMIFGQLGFDIPLADLAARERAQLAEEAELLEGQTREQAFDALREAHSVAHDVEHCTANVALLRERHLPALTRLLEVRERQLTAGETTVLVMLDARRRLLHARGALARAEADLAWAQTRAFLLLQALEDPS